MTYRARTLLAACIGLALVAGLGAWAYFGLYRAEQRRERDAVLAELVFDLDEQRVTAVRYQRGELTAVIERGQTGPQGLPEWRLTAPVAAAADGAVINGVLSSLKLMSAEQRIPLAEADPLASYGLDPPRASWILTLRDGERLSLDVGRRSPFNGQLYIRPDGRDAVVLVAGRLERSLVRSLYDLRRKDLLAVEPDRVRRLEVVGRGAGEVDAGRIVLERRAGRWELTAPIADRADARTVRHLLQRLRNLRAKAFIERDVDDALLGLEPPDWRVVIDSGADGRRQEVLIGKGRQRPVQGKVYVRRLVPPGPRAQVALHHWHGLDKSVFDYRFKAPVAFEPERVAKIQIARTEALVVLERADRRDGGGSGWSLLAPRAGPAKAYKVESLLGGLAGLRASRFAGAAEPAALERWGLAEPRATIRLFDPEGQQLARLRIGPATDEGTAVLGTARDAICLVPDDDLAALPTTAEQLAQ
jgi:hypothetical protein